MGIGSAGVAPSGSSLDFDTTTSVVTVGPVTNQNTNITISVWAKLDDVNQRGLLAYVGDSNGNGYGIFVSDAPGTGSGKRISLLLGGVMFNALGSTTDLDPNQWVNYAVTRSGTNWSFYVNGALTNTGTASPNGTPTLGVQTGYGISGNITDTRFYERALSATEIAQLAGGGQNPDSTNLKVSLNYNDGSGSVVTDVSGNNYNGSIGGSSSWSTDIPSALGYIQTPSVFLTSTASARTALDSLKTAVDSILAIRGGIGAQMSRLAIAASHIGSARVATTEAARRITDADIASESSQLVRATILQRTGQAILAQANQSPSLALSLLKNI